VVRISPICYTSVCFMLCRFGSTHHYLDTGMSSCRPRLMLRRLPALRRLATLQYTCMLPACD
jgi:hypothetical protein